MLNLLHKATLYENPHINGTHPLTALSLNTDNVDPSRQACTTRLNILPVRRPSLLSTFYQSIDLFRSALVGKLFLPLGPS